MTDYRERLLKEIEKAGQSVAGMYDWQGLKKALRLYDECGGDVGSEQMSEDEAFRKAMELRQRPKEQTTCQEPVKFKYGSIGMPEYTGTRPCGKELNEKGECEDHG